MSASIPTTRIRGEEVSLLSCGCSPKRSEGRSRCEVAREMHREERRLREIRFSLHKTRNNASPECREADMAHRLKVREIDEHLARVK